jgi:hypothetical protein
MESIVIGKKENEEVDAAEHSSATQILMVFPCPDMYPTLIST